MAMTPGRREKKRWSEREEQALIDGVLKFGRSRWKEIWEVFFCLSSRTPVDLKVQSVCEMCATYEWSDARTIIR